MLNRFNAFLLLGLFLAHSAAAAVSTGVRLNSVGFLPNNVKRASIFGAGAVGFNVRRSGDASIAYSGTLSAAATNADTAESLRTADFTALTESGNFYLDVSGLGTSPVFAIGADVYNDAFWAEVMGFYSHRCGTAVSYTWKGQTFGHGACHLNDAYQDSIGGGHVIRDGKRGWHDAGDYGKYTVNGAFATAMLLQAWEWHQGVIAQWVFPIPESGGAIPDYLDEVKWNLDWLLKMQAANGSAYHKLTTYNFASFVMPEADTADTQYAPAGSHATADLCGVMAMAARLYAPYDAAFAAQCQLAADRAWAWLQANPGEVLPNLAGFGTGAYNETGTDADHRAFAAAQYWESTGNAAALTDFESRMAADADGVSPFWDWGEYAYGKRGPKNHGIFSYLLSSRSGRNAARVSALTNDLLAEANALVATRNAHGYGRPLGAEYHWGSNGTVARQVMLLDCADQLSPNSAYVDSSLDALGHLFGRNTYTRSFVTGVGYNPALNPHDRHSASDGIANPVPGHLVGGAESTADSWSDTQGDFTTNEIAINWDAALVAALARFITVPAPATPTPTPSPTPCFSATALRRVNVGGTAQTTGGFSWSADQAYAAGGWGYMGGAVSTNSNAIAGSTDDVLYNTGRYGMSQYQFTVTNGDYRVQMHFAETYFSAAGARVMSVTLEGQPAISNLDIYATVGGSTALVLTRDINVSDGILTLGFSASADVPEIRAIAIFPATTCPATPTFTPSPNWTATPSPSRTPSFTASPTRTPSPSVSPTPSLSPTPCGEQVVARIRSGGGAFTDGLGQAWSADQYYSGGATTSVTNAISGTSDDALYQTERYGDPLAYAIPVPASGSYRVRFLWAETFCAAAACRVFSVTLEGAAAITNLDLYAVAGANAAYQVTRTVSVSDGTLNLGATASVDNAKFDAIEVIWLAPACSSPTATPSPGLPSATATRTASPSPTATLSPTRTASPSPSVTASRSASPTPSASPSATPSRTRSATPTASPTASLTPTATETRTASPAPSLSVSPSPTRSPTPVPGSPTVSPSPDPSATASPTPTRTGTLSGTPSRTATVSITVSRSTTLSVTPSPTPSFSPTLSASPSLTWTLSVSASPSVTPSFSAVPPGSTATATPSPSWTASPTETWTASVTVTSTPSATRTSSLTESPSPSKTASATQTRTATPSVSPADTASATATASATTMPAATATPSPSSTAFAGPLPTATASPTSIPAVTSAPYGQDLRIEQSACLPNPVRGPFASFRFKLSGPADTLHLRLYSRAFVCLSRQELHGNFAAGWNSVHLDLAETGAGSYFVRAEAESQGLRSIPSAPLRLVRIP